MGWPSWKATVSSCSVSAWPPPTRRSSKLSHETELVKCAIKVDSLYDRLSCTSSSSTSNNDFRILNTRSIAACTTTQTSLFSSPVPFNSSPAASFVPCGRYEWLYDYPPHYRLRTQLDPSQVDRPTSLCN